MAGLDTMIFPFYTEYWSFLVSSCYFLLELFGAIRDRAGTECFEIRIFKSKIVRLCKATNDKRRTTNN
uniref:Uncharacterized protein n=1 Tax=Caenorhabditis japonica TaxID=281687 RepID=A0A8R1ESN0_CAEJA